MPTPPAIDAAALPRFFKALADPTRLRLVGLLAHGELCVCHLESGLELAQPAVSRHLAVLRAAAIVRARRQGSWMHYALVEQTDPACRAQLESLVRGFLERKDLARDVARLRRSGGPDACAPRKR